MKPECIIFDEPTAMLDPSGRREVLNNIKEINEKYGITIVLITHYMDEAAEADRVLVMDDGKIILEGNPREVFSNVKQMKEIGLDVPQVTELCYELKNNGIKIENLVHVYMPKSPFEKVALNNVNIEINEGEFVALIGHTGSGKSTLIQHMNGLLKPTSGRIVVDGEDITKDGVKLTDIRKKVGLVFQYPEYQLFEETIEKDIEFGPRNLGLSDDEITKRVKKSMEMVGLDYDTYRNKSPFDLSGGQKRRVAIAGVIAMEPKVLILDEPTAGLDPKGRDDILEQIKVLHDEYKMTIILVSHSMEDVGKLAERIIVMNKGEVALEGTPAKVFKEVETLENIGLAVPQVTYLMRELKRRGFNVSDEIYTIKQGKKELLRILKEVKS